MILGLLARLFRWLSWLPSPPASPSTLYRNLRPPTASASGPRSQRPRVLRPGMRASIRVLRLLRRLVLEVCRGFMFERNEFVLQYSSCCLFQKKIASIAAISENIFLCV